MRRNIIFILVSIFMLFVLQPKSTEDFTSLYRTSLTTSLTASQYETPHNSIHKKQTKNNRHLKVYSYDLEDDFHMSDDFCVVPLHDYSEKKFTVKSLLYYFKKVKIIKSVAFLSVKKFILIRILRI